MECLYCGTTLAPLRGAEDGGYCSDDHRLEHSAKNSSAQYLFLLEPPVVAGSSPNINDWVPTPVAFGFPPRTLTLETEFNDFPFRFQEAGLLPWSPVPTPSAPKAPPDEIAPRLAAAKPALPQPMLIPYTPALQPDPPPPLLNRVGAFALRHWKLSFAMLPLAFVALIDTTPPRTPARKQTASSVSSMPMLASFRNTLRRRAAVQFSDDFRSGLDEWVSNQSLATSWTYDAAGFVHPGALAVYRPTMGLEDYSVEFLGQIEQKGMGLAFRVVDWNHYYVLKLELVKTGPLPALELVRYAVEGNREVSKSSRHFPLTFRDTSLCRFRLNVRGNEFTLINQGQIVDDWTDDRYPKGGIGFFCGKGERARLRWVEVSHQIDSLGRICAFLTPSDSQN